MNDKKNLGEIGNSFFDQHYEDLKVLVLVPHEDDEINTACMLIKTLADCGAQITLVYTTNGDWKYPAEIRIREAVKACSLLGIGEDRILFLGYGDAISNDLRDHLFYHDTEPAVSPAGFRETYGAAGYNDYVFSRNQIHHSYININYLNDIIAVIKDIRPDLIICTDFDEHPDHRMLSLYFDKAIGKIKKELPDYSPEVWKRFAYSMAYGAAADLSPVNNPQTGRPETGVTEKYQWDPVDTSIYDWQKRIRIPVPAIFRDGDLRKNKLVPVLKQHHSQYIVRQADRIINSDEIYWVRRTDSLSYSAEVKVSSGEARFLTDFQLYDIENIDEPVPVFRDYCWTPDPDDSHPTAFFHWNHTVCLRRIVVYGSVTSRPGEVELEIVLSNGYKTTVKDAGGRGRPIVLDLPAKANVDMCSISLLCGRDSGYGISEVEFYSEKTFPSRVHPFLKILIDDNFAYEYYIDPERIIIPIEVYSFGDTGEVSINVISGQSRIEGEELYVDPGDDVITLRAETKTGGVYDQIVIRKLHDADQKRFSGIKQHNDRYIKFIKFKYKVHNMLYILQRQGIKAVLLRTINNVIKPGISRKG